MLQIRSGVKSNCFSFDATMGTTVVLQIGDNVHEEVLDIIYRDTSSAIAVLQIAGYVHQ